MENRERIITEAQRWYESVNYEAGASSIPILMADFILSTNWSDLKSQFAFEEGQRVERVRIANDLRRISFAPASDKSPDTLIAKLSRYIEKLEEKL